MLSPFFLLERLYQFCDGHDQCCGGRHGFDYQIDEAFLSFPFFLTHSVTSFPFDNIIIAHKYVLVKQKNTFLRAKHKKLAPGNRCFYCMRRKIHDI